MTYWAALFLMVAGIAAIFAFGIGRTPSADAAETMFFVFLVLGVGALALRLVRGRDR